VRGCCLFVSVNSGLFDPAEANKPASTDLRCAISAGRMPSRKILCENVSMNAIQALLQGFHHRKIFPTNRAQYAGRGNNLFIFDRSGQNASLVRAIPLSIADGFGNSPGARQIGFCDMLKVKDTLRATVNLTFDGRVIKAYHGPDAQTRFENEVRVLRHLEARGCNFVPKLLEADATLAAHHHHQLRSAGAISGREADQGTFRRTVALRGAA
jgi:hypothetical protein